MSASEVGVVAVGDELLAGAHPDLNSPYLASRMVEFGRRVTAVRVVGDDVDAIRTAVEELARTCALVFTSGGLGPTLDDVTRHGVAAAAGEPLEESSEVWEALRDWFERSGRVASESNRRQALFPRGARILENAHGTAPGFHTALPNGADVLVLPGPPRELQGMFRDVVEPWLAARPVDALHRVKRAVSFADVPESEFAEAVGGWMSRDANPLIGVTVKEGVLIARCLATSEDEAEAVRLAESRASEIRALFPDRWLGGEVARLGQFVGSELTELGLRFTVAESCTGGRVAAALTDAAGVSAAFHGSFVTYDNGWKARDLGVPETDLEQHGAVSDVVARAMAEGALERAGADVALSVTGIAGPTGGTDQKPVGLVWFGIATRGADGAVTSRAVERRWPAAGRSRVRAWATTKALALLLRAGRDLRSDS